LDVSGGQRGKGTEGPDPQSFEQIDQFRLIEGRDGQLGQELR